MKSREFERRLNRQGAPDDHAYATHHRIRQRACRAAWPPTAWPTPPTRRPKPRSPRPLPPEATVAPLVITAERRTTNLQTAPVVATVLQGQSLQAAGIQNLDDLQFHTPSLTVCATSVKGNLFNIRGIGKDLTNDADALRRRDLLWDGVAAFPGFFADAPLLRHLQHRGAARSLRALSPARTPPAARSSSQATIRSIGAGQRRYLRRRSTATTTTSLLRGAVNIPVNDTLAVRIAFNGEHRDSFYTVAGPWKTPDGTTPGRQYLGSARAQACCGSRPTP